MPARVVIVEDDGFTRMLLRGQLQNLGYEVAADHANARDALAAARELQPDIAVVDLDLGRGPTGIDLAHALREALPTIGIVLLTSYADTRLIGDQRPLPDGGIYVVKRSLEDAAQLQAALTMAQAGGGYPVRFSPGGMPRLSDGQVEILRLVANGFSNAEIASRRHLSESAVIKAVARLVDQLGLTPQPGDNQRILLTMAYFRFAGTTGERRG